MFQTSYIELSRSALHSNIRYLKRQLPKGTRFSSVIKGNAYGHGIELFLPLVEQCNVRHFSVFSANEALSAMAARTKKSEIMIMGDIENAELGWAIENNVSFYIFDLDRLKAAEKTARKIGAPARIHMELETGLHRTGLQGAIVKQAFQFIRRHPDSFKLEGVCTHFAGAESISNYMRITKQIDIFNQLCATFAEQGLKLGPGGTLRHTACSAAALLYPETIMDMVRIGIAQYGFWPSKETEIQFFHQHSAKRRRKAELKDPLIRVLKWTSRVMSVKKIKQGDFVGYGTSSLALRPMRVAAIPVGYFHGYSRNLSNMGHVLIRGERAPVVGTVNMNMVMVDVTDVPGAGKGDEVVLIGRQGDKTISVGAFGEMIRIINYEILVRLPSEIPRVVVE